MKWHKMSEYPSEDGLACLVLTKTGTITRRNWSVKSLELCGDGFGRGYRGTCKMAKNLIAWAPLPELPEWFNEVSNRDHDIQVGQYKKMLLELRAAFDEGDHV